MARYCLPIPFFRRTIAISVSKQMDISLHFLTPRYGHILVFWLLPLLQNSKGTPSAGALNTRDVCKKISNIALYVENGMR